MNAEWCGRAWLEAELNVSNPEVAAWVIRHWPPLYEAVGGMGLGVEALFWERWTPTVLESLLEQGGARLLGLLVEHVPAARWKGVEPDRLWTLWERALPNAEAWGSLLAQVTPDRALETFAQVTPAYPTFNDDREEEAPSPALLRWRATISGLAALAPERGRAIAEQVLAHRSRMGYHDLNSAAALAWAHRFEEPWWEMVGWALDERGGPEGQGLGTESMIPILSPQEPFPLVVHWEYGSGLDREAMEILLRPEAPVEEIVAHWRDGVWAREHLSTLTEHPFAARVAEAIVHHRAEHGPVHTEAGRLAWAIVFDHWARPTLDFTEASATALIWLLRAGL
ncbi:MAG: hypothetical protein AAFS10_21365, partial [Myxococcota bacterium]